MDGWRIRSCRCRGVARAELDGEVVSAAAIPLIEDGGIHQVRIVLGAVRVWLMGLSM